MVNPAIAHLSKRAIMKILDEEARRRRLSMWGPWEHIELTEGLVGGRPGGLLSKFTMTHRNLVFNVLDRTLRNGVRHLGVSSLSQIRPSWYEMMRIKNELAGAHATAVEVYPPQLEIVDGADMFHIWVLPHSLGFSLCDDRDETDGLLGNQKAETAGLPATTTA